MTPEREAQMRGALAEYMRNEDIHGGYVSTRDFDAGFRAAVRSLEPMVRDGERLQAYCMTRNPENDALLQIELRILNGEVPTMDEWRTAIDAAVGAALEDGNATE